MKKETAELFLSLTNGREVFTIKEVDGELSLTWDMSDDEMSQIVEKEFGKVVDLDIQFELIVRSILEISVQHAKTLLDSEPKL